jgi:ATP/ADP translocase
MISGGRRAGAPPSVGHGLDGEEPRRMEPIQGWNPETIDLTSLQAMVFLGVYLLSMVVFVVAYVSIIRRAGYSGWWILTTLVPVLNIVMFFLFAFKEWPVQQQLRSAQMVASMANAPNRDARFTWS